MLSIFGAAIMRGPFRDGVEHCIHEVRIQKRSNGRRLRALLKSDRKIGGAYVLQWLWTGFGGGAGVLSSL